jgi:uncharacterized protein YecE (DUF72 family)
VSATKKRDELIRAMESALARGRLTTIEINGTFYGK